MEELRSLKVAGEPKNWESPSARRCKIVRDCSLQLCRHQGDRDGSFFLPKSLDDLYGASWGPYKLTIAEYLEY